MPVVATKTVPNNRRVEVELPDVEPGTLVTVMVVPANSVPAVDANTARRKANGWLADHVGHLVMGKTPRILSDGKRVWWRVDTYVTNVYREPFGPIGFVDIDAVSGEVLAADDTAQKLGQHGAQLERQALAAGD